MSSNHIDATTTARNTMGGTRPRNADDAYYTPDALALAICQRLRETIGVPGLVVEPSAGDGAFVRAARSTWFDGPMVIAVEPHAPRAIDGATAFLPVEWESRDAAMAVTSAMIHTRSPVLVVGNPPYFQAEQHVRIALDLLGHFERNAPGRGYLALLLRASFLAGLRRVDGLWADAPPRYVWHVAPRPSFTNGGTDGAEYAVIVWQAGWRGPYEGGWMRWER